MYVVHEAPLLPDPVRIHGIAALVSSAQSSQRPLCLRRTGVLGAAGQHGGDHGPGPDCDRVSDGRVPVVVFSERQVSLRCGGERRDPAHQLDYGALAMIPLHV